MEKVAIWKEERWQRLQFNRIMLTSNAAVEWQKLDLPTDGNRFYIRNESGAVGLDVSFEEDPRNKPTPSFFHLTALGVVGYDRTMDFIPRHCWVRQTGADQMVYFEVTDEPVGEEEQA